MFNRLNNNNGKGSNAVIAQLRSDVDLDTTVGTEEDKRYSTVGTEEDKRYSTVGTEEDKRCSTD